MIRLRWIQLATWRGKEFHSLDDDGTKELVSISTTEYFC